MIATQLDIFSFIKPIEVAPVHDTGVDLEEMTEAEMIRQIEKATGIEFTVDAKADWCEATRFVYYCGKKNKSEIAVHFSRYSCDGYNNSFYKGQKHISVSYDKNYGDYHGFGCPCDTIESAIHWVEKGLGYAEQG